jgi:putative DNA primase/helicase
LIPFERHFSENEQDKGLKALFKQPGNMSGILNWFLDGLRLMHSEGLTQPQTISDATEQYREDSDTVGLFIRECLIEVTPSHKLKAKAVHAEYSRWCDENGYGALNTRNLNAELRKKGLKIERSTDNLPHLFGYGLACTDEIPPEFL